MKKLLIRLIFFLRTSSMVSTARTAILHKYRIMMDFRQMFMYLPNRKSHKLRAVAFTFHTWLSPLTQINCKIFFTNTKLQMSKIRFFLLRFPNMPFGRTRPIVRLLQWSNLSRSVQLIQGIATRLMNIGRPGVLITTVYHFTV